MNPLTLTLRAAWQQLIQQPQQATRYDQEILSILLHWERCTSNPPLAEVTNAVMANFRREFLSQPLPSKVQWLANRCSRGDAQSLQLLRELGLDYSRLRNTAAAALYPVIRDKMAALSRLPDSARELLTSPARFNNVRCTIEAILSKLGPPGPGKRRFALGLLPAVPLCQPADEEDPDVVVASAEEVSAIYDHCHVAQWPPQCESGVAPADLFRALTVYVFNVASRREDFLQLEKVRVRLDEGVILNRQKKTGKFRAVPINQVVVRHLQPLWPAASRLVFPFPRNKRDLYQTWEKIQQAAGIHVARPAGSRRRTVYGFHELRKTSLTEYFAISERAAQAMGCHSSMNTTLKHYVSATRKDGMMRQASESLPQPEAFTKTPAGDPSPPRLRIVS